MEKIDLDIGDIVQLDPEMVRTKAFAGCLMIVTEIEDNQLRMFD